MTDEKEVLELLLKYVSDWNCASADEYPYFTDELGHACNDAIKLIDYKNKENTKLKADVEQFSNELISVLIENELLKKKNELTNHYFKQYAAAIDEVEQLKEDYSLLSRQYDDVENSCVRYYNEVKQLKSELEQSVKLQNVLSKLLKGSEFARCYMCDNSMKNITLDGKNNGCDGSCYHAKEYTEKDLLDKIKRELDRTKGLVSE